MMYVSLRVTGNLIWPVLLHATTDPSTFLATQYPTTGTLATIASFGNLVVIITGFVLISFVRGRVATPAGPGSVTDRGPA